MRTTIRLPDELYKQVRITAISTNRTVTAFITEALRDALAHQRQEPPPPQPYRVKPFAGDGLQPGVDLDDNAALLDLMQADARA